MGLGETNIIPQTQDTPVTISRGHPSPKSRNPSCPAPNKMPYRRRSYRPRTTRKRTTRKGYGGRTSRRRYPTTRRRYPRKMSNKRILNLTSRKKRDTMLSYTNTSVTTPVGSPTYNTGPATLRGDQTYLFAWVPTARSITDGTGITNSVYEISQRTATSCYMRGLKEAVNIRTNSSNAWQWRRICFTFKGYTLYPTDNQNNQPYQYFSEVANLGMVRTMNNLNTNDKGNRLLERIFRGTQNEDWLNVFNAMVDTQRVSVMSDRTRTIASGNDSGVVRTYKQWYPMNKNILYNDEEAGDDMIGSYTSAQSKVGMGDYYIVDFFQCSDGGDQSDLMTVLPEATLYWHEK